MLVALSSADCALGYIFGLTMMEIWSLSVRYTKE